MSVVGLNCQKNQKNKKMGKDPAFLFYSGDFLSGTIDMSCEEVGAYIRLLAYQHQHGSIPSSTDRLMRIVGIYPEARFEEIWKVVGKKFVVDCNQMVNQMVNERLNHEMNKRKIYKPKKIASATLAGLISKNTKLSVAQIKRIKQEFNINNFIDEDTEKIKQMVRIWFNQMVNQMVSNLENENEINKLISLEDSTSISLDKSLSLKEEEDKESLLLVPNEVKKENLVKEKGVKKKVAQKSYREKRLVDVKEEDLAGEENGLYYARLALEIQQAIMLNMQEAGISTKIIENIKGKAIDEVRLMLTKQECTEQQLYDAIDFLRKDSFWKTVVLSISKFREKLPNLLIKISENENVKGNNRFANERKHAEATRVASFIASGLNGSGIKKG